MNATLAAVSMAALFSLLAMGLGLLAWAVVSWSIPAAIAGATLVWLSDRALERALT